MLEQHLWWYNLMQTNKNSRVHSDDVIVEDFAMDLTWNLLLMCLELCVNERIMKAPVELKVL